MPIHPLFAGAALLAYLGRDTTVQETAAVLEEWEPAESLDKESDYRDDLAEFLEEELPDAYVITEHGLGRGRRDILIENRETEVKVAIELKYQLHSSNEANRLLGQVLRYGEGVKAIFVILIDPERNYLAEFERIVKANPALSNVEIATLYSEDEEDDENNEYEEDTDQEE